MKKFHNIYIYKLISVILIIFSILLFLLSCYISYFFLRLQKNNCSVSFGDVPILVYILILTSFIISLIISFFNVKSLSNISKNSKYFYIVDISAFIVLFGYYFVIGGLTNIDGVLYCGH